MEEEINVKIVQKGEMFPVEEIVASVKFLTEEEIVLPEPNMLPEIIKIVTEGEEDSHSGQEQE
jgi:hypothetical protein